MLADVSTYTNFIGGRHLTANKRRIAAARPTSPRLSRIGLPSSCPRAGTVITDGEADGEGCLISPTVFEGVGESAVLSARKVVGSVACLDPRDTIDDAIARSNAVTIGPSATILTRDLKTADRFHASCRQGILHVNSQTAGAEVHVPFGGIKSFGLGPHEPGPDAREFYTDVVTVYVDA